VIRDSELELGGSLVHPLQAFPDGTHDRSMKPRLMPSRLLLARLSLTARGRIAHCRHADETRFDISVTRIMHAIQHGNCRSFPSDLTFPSTRVAADTIICSTFRMSSANSSRSARVLEALETNELLIMQRLEPYAVSPSLRQHRTANPRHYLLSHAAMTKCNASSNAIRFRHRGAWINQNVQNAE
jgi:hypothetical protein